MLLPAVMARGVALPGSEVNMKGMIFKPESIQAIVEGRKTQTRRVIKPQPDRILESLPYQTLLSEPTGYIVKRIKPRYQVGETAYIKEALYRHPYFNETGYLLDETAVMANQVIGVPLKWRWKRDFLSPLHCPEDAARYFITITDVRAERLQEITAKGIMQEGLPDEYENYEVRDAVEWFIILWNSINKDYPFESNPWVWVISFKRV